MSVEHACAPETVSLADSTVIVRMREPETALSVGISHSPSVALRSGEKLPPLRSASITASTDGGSDDSFSPLTTPPASWLSRRT